jgi:hypothetical protein
MLAFEARVAEIIELKDILQARARRRERALTARCVAIMEDCLAAYLADYDRAPLQERFGRATKIRQLEDLIDYAANLA